MQEQGTICNVKLASSSIRLTTVQSHGNLICETLNYKKWAIDHISLLPSFNQLPIVFLLDLHFYSVVYTWLGALV